MKWKRRDDTLSANTWLMTEDRQVSQELPSNSILNALVILEMKTEMFQGTEEGR